MKCRTPVSRTHFLKFVYVTLVTGFCALGTRADQTPQTLPYVQDWSKPGLITADNDWSGVPGMMGFRGDKLIAKPGVSPQGVVPDGSSTPVQVLANQQKPNSLRTGGVAEFDGIDNPTIALKGSGTAAAPMLILHLDTRGKQNIAVGYKLRDLESSANNAVQAVALQYRVGTNAAFVDIPAAFVADATTGPGVATLVTPIVIVLPAEANDEPLIQVRWITANAEGNDEWVGIDEIAVIGDDLAFPVTDNQVKDKSAKSTKL